MTRRLSLAGALVAAYIVAAFAQAAGSVTVTVLVVEGDEIAGVGSVTGIDNLAVNDHGSWILEVDTDAQTDVDSVLLRDGGIYLREGQTLALPRGATIDSFDSVNINNDAISGWNFFLDGTKDIFDDSGVYTNDELLIQESDASAARGFTPGTPYIGFFEVKINNADPPQLLIMASVDDPAIESSVDRALVIVSLDANGETFTEFVLYKEGDILPGQVDAVDDFGTGPHDFAFNDFGDVMFVAELAGPAETDQAVYRNDVLLAQEGSRSPIEGRLWSSLSSAVVTQNNNGDHAYRGSLDGDTDTNILIVRNGSKLVQEGDVMPDTNGAPLSGLGAGPIDIDDQGRVLWYGEWTDPDRGEMAGLFLEDQLVIAEGAEIDRHMLESIAGGQDGFAMSDSGRYILFEGDVAGSDDGAFLIDLGASCAQDLDGDDLVGTSDLIALLGAWGTDPGGPPDFDGDGVVGAGDLIELLGAWGPCE